MDKVYDYIADEKRYEQINYVRCGNSGLKLPEVSLGLWHNFGAITEFGTQQQILRTAFDNGVTHFDLANNYGPPYGEAERNFGIHFERDWRPYRDQLVISTKAGYDMWQGPYGDHGSRKYLIASLDQSLKRMHLDYVDIFYHHRPDPETPLEETMTALDHIVRSGKALYVGISNYPPELTQRAIDILRDLGTPLLIHQMKYSMFERTPEQGLLEVLKQNGVGGIAFSPLANGVLSDKYLQGIPADSRAAHDPRFLKPTDITPEVLAKVGALNELAQQRGETLAQMALQWIRRSGIVTSVLVGASRPRQVVENIQAFRHAPLTREECERIDEILK